MKKYLLCVLGCLLVYISFAQKIPSTIRTEYLQVFIGGKNGTSITQDIAKECVIFTIDNENNIVERECESKKTLVKIKIITSEETKYFSNGWSKRFCGYDPNNFTIGPDGSINLTDYYTIILKDNKYEIFTETVSVDVSLGTRFFNL